MTNPNIVVVNSTISQTGVDAGDYKTLLIVDPHWSSFDRVTSYAAGGYTDIPTTTKLYKALNAAFSQDLKPSVVKVGRAKGAAVYTPSAVAETKEYGFTITVKDGYSLNETYTTGAAETAEDVVTALKTQFDLDSDITDHVTLTVSGTGAAAALIISLVASADDYTVTTFTGDYTLEGTASEAAADTLEAISDVDDDWSWLVTTSHTPSYQTAMASAVEALIYKKYFTSSQLEENYESWDEVSVPDPNNVGALIVYGGYTRTNVFYDHEADTKFPEAARYSKFALKEPGRSDFQCKEIVGFGRPSFRADASQQLNKQEILNLEQNFVTTIVRQGGLNLVAGNNGQGNRMASGVRIETKYWTDRAAQVIEQRVLSLKVNKDKLGFNDDDISSIKGTIESWLDTQVSTIGSTYALDPVRPFQVIVPKYKDISFEDKVAGLLQGIQVIAYSDASIDKVIVDLNVTFNSES